MLILAMKEICIFMLIAQAILFFVPGGTYTKYVRILAGVLIIFRITEPLLEFFAGEDVGRQMQERMAGIFEEAKENEQILPAEEGSGRIYRGIEEELKKKLVLCRNDYAVKEVILNEKEGMVLIMVELQEGEEKVKAGGSIRIPPVVLGNEETLDEGAAGDNLTYGEMQELKEQYGNCIGVGPESIVIRIAGG